MRVVFYASGKSYHAVRWANALCKHGIEVHFISIHRLERNLALGVKFYNIGIYNNKIGYLRLFKALRICLKISPDIIHVHSFGGYSTLSLLASMYYKSVISAYGSDIYITANKSYLFRLMFDIFLKTVNIVCATSNDLGDSLHDTLSVNRFINIIPFGVDGDMFPLKDNVNSEGIIRFGVIKKLEPIYGIDTLIHAFLDLLKLDSSPMSELHIYGNGSEMQTLISLSGEEYEKTIFFHGLISHEKVPKVLAELDIFVVPSRSESFGVSALEASFCGLPVIASRVGGLPEVIIEGKTGLLFESENILELASLLERLASNKVERIRLGLNGARHARKKYSWNCNVESMIEIYKGLL